jgi:hypothetical protein
MLLLMLLMLHIHDSPPPPPPPDASLLMLLMHAPFSPHSSYDQAHHASCTPLTILHAFHFPHAYVPSTPDPYVLPRILSSLMLQITAV